VPSGAYVDFSGLTRGGVRFGSLLRRRDAVLRMTDGAVGEVPGGLFDRRFFA
jgi:hypothetical protein